MGPTYASIPMQTISPYDASATTPDTGGYQKFMQGGYSFVQNLAANVILQEETGVQDASITIMAIPMPAENTIVDSFASVLA